MIKGDKTQAEQFVRDTHLLPRRLPIERDDFGDQATTGLNVRRRGIKYDYQDFWVENPAL
jgi:hypothetical protein